MITRTLTRSILSILLVALVISAGNFVFGDPAIFVSLSPGSPDSARIGANNVGLRFIVDNPMGQEQTIEALGIQAAGNLSYIGSVYVTGNDFTLQSQHFTDQEPYYEVHWANPDGIFTLPPGKSELDFWFFVDKDTPVGAKFIFYIFEECFYTIADNDGNRIPGCAIPVNPVQGPTILIEIGELTVQQTIIPPSYVEVGTTAVPFEADLINSQIEPARVDTVLLDVQGTDPANDLTELAVSIDGVGLGTMFVSRGINVFNGNWHIEQGAVGKLRCTIFAQTGVGHEFSVKLIEIEATGKSYGFNIPVYGLPIGGDIIKIVGPDKPTTGFYGYATDLSGKPLKATILAINEPLKQKVKAVSGDNGYYEIIGLVSAMHWLFCCKQYFYMDVAREFVPAGKMVRVDFVLLEKPQSPKPPKPPKPK